VSRLLFIVLALGFVLAAATLVGLRLRRDGASRQTTLTTGNKVEVLAVLPGSQTFNSEKPWQRQLRKVLPGGMLRWLPTPAMGHCSSGTNSATLYLRVESLAPFAPLPWANYVAEDDAGFRYPMEGGYCSFGGGAGGGGPIYGFTLRASPRRQKDFLVRFFDARRVELGAVRVKNPLPGPFPEWQAEPLPTTHTNGPVALTLESCAVAGQPNWRHLQPKWRLEATEPRWAKARAGYAMVADATGNEASILSPREPVWRIRTRVHRQRREDFRPEERAVFEKLAAPGPGEAFVVERTAEVSGVKVRLRTLASQGTLYFTNDVMGVLAPGKAGDGSTSDGIRRVNYWSSDKPFVLLETRGATWDDETRIRVTDQDGRELKLDEGQGASGHDGGVMTLVPKFTLPTNTTALTFEVIVSRALTFDFFVNPREVQGIADLESAR
jgi:hypothetical protein